MDKRFFTHANLPIGNNSTNQDLIEDTGDLSLSRERFQPLPENNSNISFELVESSQAVASTAFNILSGGFTPKIKEPMKKFFNLNE